MRTALIAAIGMALPAAAYAAGYEMKDLETLSKQGQWQELMEHLDDIPPSKRDAKWQSLAERACASVLAAIEVDDRSLERVIGQSDAMIKRYPALGRSSAFMAKRADVGLQAFRKSFGHYSHNRGDDPWLGKLIEFVRGDTSTADLPLRAAQLANSLLVKSCSIPILKIGVERSAAAVCKAPDLAWSVVSALEDGVWLKDVGELAKARCWNELRGPISAALEKSTSRDFTENACPLLKEKNALTPVQAQKCK
jgi:hypothetical protein